MAPSRSHLGPWLCLSQIHEPERAWGKPCGTRAMSPASLDWASGGAENV